MTMLNSRNWPKPFQSKISRQNNKKVQPIPQITLLTLMIKVHYSSFREVEIAFLETYPIEIVKHLIF